MIYEVHTTALRPGAMSEAVARTKDALPARVALSPLAALWQSEIGGLNRIVLVWPYRDLAHRADVHDAVSEVREWPPDTAELTAAERVEIVTPAPFMRPLTDAPTDGVLELRTYTYHPGTMGMVLQVWADAVPARERLSPLLACWYTAIGDLHRFSHVWPYRSLEERAAIRAEAVRQGIWPPDTRQWRIREESSILLPIAFGSEPNP